MSKRLRVVADEMLGACSDALALDAIDNGSTKMARQQGIFTEALKVATATRISVDVDGRPQHNLSMLELGLLGYLLSQALQELGVPCGRQAGCVGEAGCRKLTVKVSWPDSIDGVDSLGNNS